MYPTWIWRKNEQEGEYRAVCAELDLVVRGTSFNQLLSDIQTAMQNARGTDVIYNIVNETLGTSY